MAKQYVGIDIGSERLKLAVCNDEGVVQVAIQDVPDNLVQDGRVISYDAVADVLRDVVRENKIGTKACAVALHTHDVFTRRITLPAMSVSELDLNLPFEFRDYIADDKDKYRFDYALLSMTRDSMNQPVEMELLAAAAPLDTIEAYTTMARRAGLKLKIAAPDIMAYTNLIESYEKRLGFGAGNCEGAYISERDYCFVDIGSSSTKVYLFPHGMYEVTRIIEFGTKALAAAVANHFSVDEALARTYLLSDYEGAQRIQPCLDLYERLGVEIARIVSFFNFNYPDSQLSSVYCCGSGANVEPLMAAMREHLSVEVADIVSIMPSSPSVPPADLRECPAAVGIALQ